MRKGLKFVALSIAFLGLGLTNSKAEEGVYVDLSVLDSLSGAEVSTSAKPLFPVVKKEIKAKKKVAPKVKKKQVAKKKAPAKKVEIVKQKPVIEIKEVAAEVVKPEEAVEVKEELVKVYDVSDEQAAPVVAAQEVASEKSSTADVEPTNIVEAQPAVDASTTMTKIEESTQNIVETKATNVAENTAPDAADVSTELLPIVKSESLLVEESAPSEAKVEPAVEEKALEVTPEVKVEAKAEEVVSPVTDKLAANQVLFESSDATLSDVNKQKVDLIISKFENPLANKISILAYNLDIGYDVFKRKRQCLNRAIEIRSYLLQKGYKDFSIKVVNVVDEPEKDNVVEIEELK